jgi:hypothetical protein
MSDLSGDATSQPHTICPLDLPARTNGPAKLDWPRARPRLKCQSCRCVHCQRHTVHSTLPITLPMRRDKQMRFAHSKMSQSSCSYQECLSLRECRAGLIDIAVRPTGLFVSQPANHKTQTPASSRRAKTTLHVLTVPTIPLLLLCRPAKPHMHASGARLARR